MLIYNIFSKAYGHSTTFPILVVNFNVNFNVNVNVKVNVKVNFNDKSNWAFSYTQA